ncbi:MAG: J domain-containing protein, partial [Leptolyngbyaceae cyanobacterium CRU_2_3]|nr:J domain-containing protein [Leptolyngbyaceae cyanobacterium CRU_2_3]
MSDLERHYRVLGLEPGASLEEVNQAYRDLAFIWHPDRLPKDNPRLQEKAQEKLKELNQAREQLRSNRPSETSKSHKSQPHKPQTYKPPTSRSPEPPPSPSK